MPVASTILGVAGKVRVPSMVASGPICALREHMATPAPSGVPSQTTLLGGAHSGLHLSADDPLRYEHLPVKS